MEVEVIGMGVEEEGSSTPNGRFYDFFFGHMWSQRSLNWNFMNHIIWSIDWNITIWESILRFETKFKRK